MITVASWHRLDGLLLLPLMLVPFFVEGSYGRHLLILCCIYAVVASHWNLTLGYAGILNFAHPAFFGLGAYSAGIAAKFAGLSPWLGLALGPIVAMAAAAIVTLPVLRRSGIFVVLITFAFAQLCLQLIVSQPWLTGGMQGLVTIPTLQIGDYRFARDGKLAFALLAVALLVAATLFLRAVVSSRFGESLVALRDHEEYARSRGVPMARQRLLAMVASAAFTGTAGAFQALYLRVVSPDVLGFSLSTLFLSMVIVGGIGTLWGPIVAAFAITLLTEAMSGLGPGRFMVMAVLMVLAVRVFPSGLAGAVERVGPRARA